MKQFPRHGFRPSRRNHTTARYLSSTALAPALGTVLLISCAVPAPAFARAKGITAPPKGANLVSNNRKAHSRRPTARLHGSNHTSAHRRPRPHDVKGSLEALHIGGRHKALTGSENVINRKVLDDFVTGTNPLQALALTTPGTNFTSADGFGMDTASDTFYLRGFNLTQLGVTLDGIPMGNQMFANVGGASVNQLAIQEDIASLAVSQGAGALDTPSAQTLGGVLTYKTVDPTNKFKADISQQFASFSGYRTFIRLNSGVLNDTGTKFYAAFNRTDQNLWAGYGYQKEYVGNFKLVQPVADVGKLTFNFDYSDFDQYNALEMTNNMEHVLGYKGSYFKPNYRKAVNWANCVAFNPSCSGAAVGAPGLSGDEVSDEAYQSGQIQRAYLTGLKGEFQLAPNVRSTTLGYGQVANAWYGGTMPGFVTPAQFPMAEFRQHPDMRRIGFTQNFDIQAGKRNAIKTGLWYQNDFMETYNDLQADTPSGPLSMMHHLHKSNDQHWAKDMTNTNTFQFYLQDTFTITKGMTFLAGFRSLTQTTTGGTKWDHSAQLARQGWQLPYSHAANGSLTAAAAFLPHFSYNYHFLKNHELYADIAENMRAYDYNVQFGSSTPWSGLGSRSISGQKVFEQNKKSLKPERTWTYLVGYRYTSPVLNAAVDYYHVDYQNRLGPITSGSITNPVSSYQNLGKETMNGVDLIGTIHPLRLFDVDSDTWGDVALTNSFSYNNATYQNSHLPLATGAVNIKGKQQVYYPKFMYKMNLHYRWHRLSANFNTTYSSARNLTYTNDVKTPGFWSSELTGAYDFGRVGFVNNFQARFGVTNLFGQHYAGGIHGAAAIRGDDNPVLFMAAPREFFGTVAAQF
ncbi:TonB-dependent receptor [Formicincola oecophyllae]|uniref:TonB-dependent receptor n=1 Tax=Formicincola oecophyllae TaxID=2558361 RepID=A0A4Y6U9A3_9PROT|nr:TonB-dependent receptor [Formicincola oecophyllae]QDH13036.1 TonB-dependent receptor [Formicincola oecophyllae]